ncbi:MAG: DNA mismatch endonuclease Vsr [Acidobacteria bacterium]|nr:DNA mismatch endonuclease Vsr [Acidobacteriota bacterium]
MDILTRRERSVRMSLIRSRNTKPEIAVRRLVHGLGYRFRLHGKLAGRPDLVFRSKAKVIFVHGCFWHLHRGCPRCRPPKSRLAYWRPKLRRNAVRDTQVRRALRRSGWRSLVVWECELENAARLTRKLRRFLD